MSITGVSGDGNEDSPQHWAWGLPVSGAEEQLGPREPGECPGSHVEEGHRAEGGATAAVRTETMAFPSSLCTKSG